MHKYEMRDFQIENTTALGFTWGDGILDWTTLDLIAGLLALRTYDFEAVLELPYHHVFEDFDKVGGKGAHGLLLTFGTNR